VKPAVVRKRVARSAGADLVSIREAVEVVLVRQVVKGATGHRQRGQVITAQRGAVQLQMFVGYAGKLRPASPSPLALAHGPKAACSEHEHPGS